jgi:hypothetical protein
MSRFQDLQYDDTPSRGGGRGSRRSISVPPLIEVCDPFFSLSLMRPLVYEMNEEG